MLPHVLKSSVKVSHGIRRVLDKSMLGDLIESKGAAKVRLRSKYAITNFVQPQTELAGSRDYLMPVRKPQQNCGFQGGTVRPQIVQKLVE
jgi:hypothetical protein